MKETMKLTSETIDILSDKIGEMYKNCEATKKDTLRAKLLLEETLIKYQNHFDEEIELYFKIYRVFGQTRFVVHIKSPSFDPFSLEENPMAFMIESMMSAFEDNSPTWKYHNLENEIVFTIHKKAKMSGIVKIAIAVAISVILAIPMRIFVPNEILSNIVKTYVEPVSDAYAGLFCIMAVLLTFFAIVLSIVRIGDMSAAGITAGKILKRFYIMSSLIILLLVIPLLPYYDLGNNGSFSLAAKSIYDVIIGFIPSNIVSPFLNFNSIHIMIIGAMFGFSLLAMGQKGENTVKLFDECNLVSILTNDFLNKFIYFYVALKIFALITASDFSQLKGAGMIVGMAALGEVLIFAFYTLIVHFRTKVAFGRYFKQLIPSFVVCLSSANFGASFSSIVDGLLALDAFDEAPTIALNVGSVVFRPACTFVFVFSSLSFAKMYGIEISLVWVITTVILSLLLVAAVPNIPGVSVSVITLLFAQLGLPSDAVAMMIAINAPLQFLTVAVDTWCLAGECVCISRKR